MNFEQLLANQKNQGVICKLFMKDKNMEPAYFTT